MSENEVIEQEAVVEIPRAVQGRIDELWAMAHIRRHFKTKDDLVKVCKAIAEKYYKEGISILTAQNILKAIGRPKFSGQIRASI